MALATIGEICYRAAQIGGAVSGITSWNDPPLSAYDTAHLPTLYVLLGQAVNGRELGSGLTLETRQLRIQVPVSFVTASTPQQIETESRALIPALKTAFLARPNLGGLDGIQDVMVLGDSGTIILPEYGGQFIGFEIRIQFEYISSFAYVDSETY